MKHTDPTFCPCNPERGLHPTHLPVQESLTLSQQCPDFQSQPCHSLAGRLYPGLPVSCTWFRFSHLKPLHMLFWVSGMHFPFHHLTSTPGHLPDHAGTMHALLPALALSKPLPSQVLDRSPENADPNTHSLSFNIFQWFPGVSG